MSNLYPVYLKLKGEQKTGHCIFYLPQAPAGKEAEWTGCGLRTHLQALNPPQPDFSHHTTSPRVNQLLTLTGFATFITFPKSPFLLKLHNFRILLPIIENTGKAFFFTLSLYFLFIPQHSSTAPSLSPTQLPIDFTTLRTSTLLKTLR